MQQDYDSPPTFFKLVSGQIVRTLPQACTYEPLSLATHLPEMSMPVFPGAIRTIAYEKGEGLIRLAYPAYVNINDAFELHGSYQLSHTRVTDLSQPTWFGDQLWNVAQEFLLYWGYKLINNFKAAESQLKVAEGKLADAWRQENQGTSDVFEPEVNLGTDNWRDY